MKRNTVKRLIILITIRKVIVLRRGIMLVVDVLIMKIKRISD